MTKQELPSTAYHPTSEQFDIEAFNYNGPTAVSEVEHLMRVAFAIGGLQNGVSLAEKALEYQREYEKENIYQELTVDRSHIERSNDVFLKSEFSKLADKRQEVLDEERELIDRRIDWYENTVLSMIQNRVGNAKELMRNGVEFTTVRITEENTGEEFEIPEEELSGVNIREYGFEPPIKMTVCESASGSIYPFVPWCGTTACTGPSKHRPPTATLCKHELAALDLYSRDKFNPGGLEVGERFNRLTNPYEYNRFMNNISP